MQSSRSFILSILAMVACLFTACQSGSDMKYYNFPDAVTSINQVDPAYRKYFVDQQGRNYSADDQRKALAAAIRTSRTPVPAYVPRSAMASTKSSARRSKASSSRRAVARRGKARSSRSAVARKKTTTSRKRAVAKKKTTTRKRAVAKKRTSSRRRRG